MGRSGNIGWGVSSYFGLPNRKRKLLTKEFLQTFKEELIKIDSENNKKNNRPQLDYEKESYYSFYGQIEGTYLFYEALKIACEKHNLTNAIYKYAKRMDWYDSDCFEDDLILEMVDKGIIEKDNNYYNEEYDESEYMKAKYKLVKYYKDYSVAEYGNWFNDDRESLEEIYKDSEQKLVWLN